VLDLNGTLVLRSRSGSTVFHRPYLRTFLRYLSVASSDPKISGLSVIDLVVWSSARPHSVEKMVKEIFGPSSSLLAIWDRTHLGLSEEEYCAYRYRKVRSLTHVYELVDGKVQVTKDLQKLWAAFPHHSSATTILLDDSARKARLQPYNHLCVSEYNNVMHKETKAALEATQVDVGSRSSLDQTLLAVVGILETLRKESNISSWIRRGSLLDIASSCPADAETSAATRTEPATEPGTEPEVEKLASWWEQPDTMEFWMRAGCAVLQKLDINITDD